MEGRYNLVVHGRKASILECVLGTNNIGYSFALAQVCLNESRTKRGLRRADSKERASKW